MQVRITRSRMAGEPPDVIVAPRLGHIGLLDFDRAEEAIQEGERAMEAALEGLPVLGIETAVQVSCQSLTQLPGLLHQSGTARSLQS